MNTQLPFVHDNNIGQEKTISELTFAKENHEKRIYDIEGSYVNKNGDIMTGALKLPEIIFNDGTSMTTAPSGGGGDVPTDLVQQVQTNTNDIAAIKVINTRQDNDISANTATVAQHTTTIQSLQTKDDELEAEIMQNTGDIAEIKNDYVKKSGATMTGSLTLPEIVFSDGTSMTTASSGVASEDKIITAPIVVGSGSSNTFTPVGTEIGTLKIVYNDIRIKSISVIIPSTVNINAGGQIYANFDLEIDFNVFIFSYLKLNVGCTFQQNNPSTKYGMTIFNTASSRADILSYEYYLK